MIESCINAFNRTVAFCDTLMPTRGSEIDTVINSIAVAVLLTAAVGTVVSISPWTAIGVSLTCGFIIGELFYRVTNTPTMKMKEVLCGLEEGKLRFTSYPSQATLKQKKEICLTDNLNQVPNDDKFVGIALHEQDDCQHLTLYTGGWGNTSLNQEILNQLMAQAIAELAKLNYVPSDFSYCTAYPIETKKLFETWQEQNKGIFKITNFLKQWVF